MKDRIEWLGEKVKQVADKDTAEIFSVILEELVMLRTYVGEIPEELRAK